MFKKLKNGESASGVNWIMAAFGILLIFTPYVFTKWSWISLDYKNTGEIGDIIGGITSPFIAFVGIILTFYAFWIQYQANIFQRNDIKFERFENKYYELLSLQRDNVKEMKIGDKIEGRKCFVVMFREFKFIYYVTLNLSETHSDILNKSYTERECCNLAFIIFFYGIGQESDKAVNYLVGEDNIPIVTLIRDYLNLIQIDYTKEKGKFLKIGIDIKHKSLLITNFSLLISYFPFDGHSSRLGHYFRHLYQTVKFIVDDQAKVNLDEVLKLQYLTTLRSQLSNHEQLLLYYDALSDFGKNWIKNGYLTQYKMIHNMPIALVSCH